jgi:hypothetical protein
MAVLKRALALGVALAALCLAQSSRAQSSEYKLKAAYLCRVVDFVDWPADAFAATNSPLIIGVLGRDPFGDTLDDVAAGQVSKGHPLEIRRYNSIAEIGNCKALYICASEAPRLNSILHDLDGKEVLTVSDINNFALRNGIVQFFTDANKVRFRINLEEAKSCRLSISSRLLQLADVINGGPAAP